jgi:ornithine carbamoyltransferase
MKHLISLKEQSKSDIEYLLKLAAELKEKRNKGEATPILKDKTLLMLFQKSSTRTRLSFEAAMTDLGGHGIFMDARTSQLALTDFGLEIQAIMRFGHILMFRAKKAADVELAASFNRIPVIDACSEKYHPCQALSDLLTMSEYSGGVGNIKKITWLGIENNVSNTLALACAKMGIKVLIVAPERDLDSIDKELDAQLEASGNVERTQDLEKALSQTDYVHTDTWMNMEFFDNGAVKPEFKAEYERRVNLFKPYQLTAELIDKFSPKARIMHCMPCHVGYEISQSAIDHKNSIILDQAENRMHMQKAILVWLMEK